MPKKEERGFRYVKRTKDDLKERANMKGGNFASLFKTKYKQWTPKDGKNLIRILPPTWDDARHYGMDIFINYSIGADNEKYLSLSKHGKGADPLEEARREAQREGDKELAKALSPNQRILYWIIDRNDEDEGPILWAAPFTFDKSLSNLCIDEDTKEVIFLDDPAKGRDVRFYKEGTGLLTKYDPSKMKLLAESPICDDEGLENEWLDFIQDNPLPDVLNFYSYEHIKNTFDGQAGRKDEDEETEEKPARRRAAVEEDEPKPRGRQHVSHRASDPEDEPDEKPVRRGPRRDQELDPDDESEEKPVARGRRVAIDPDDEPEEKPVRRRAAAVADDEEDESPPSTRRTTKSEPEEGSGSLRERLARRRRSGDDD